jgi:uncharacterized membrane protein (DUF485 family)
MGTVVAVRIRSHPLFVTLVKYRRRLLTCLTLASLIPYYAFILVAAFSPQLLAAHLSSQILNVVWLVGIALIAGIWILVGLYIRRANREFDELNEKIRGAEKK